MSEEKRTAASARVLIIEDEPLIRMTVAEAFQDAGFEVAEAANADEAMAYLADREVDLVFSDVNMPGSMSGLDLARKLQTDRPSLPIILTSGSLQSSNVGAAIRLIDKPYDFEQAIALIRKTLGIG